MATSQSIVPGAVLLISDKLFRVDSIVKVTAKGEPFIKMKLRNLTTDKVMEKNFKVGQEVKDVNLEERKLEFLYLEKKEYLFLDVGTLDKVLVSPDVIGDKVQFLKEGIEINATFYGETIFSVDLPQFLELMVSKTEASGDLSPSAGSMKKALLETGAEIDVPRFIEVGDVIKVETKSREYVQRV